MSCNILWYAEQLLDLERYLVSKSAWTRCVKTCWAQRRKRLPACAKILNAPAMNSRVRNWTGDVRKSKFNFCSNYFDTCKHVGNIEGSDDSSSQLARVCNLQRSNQKPIFSSARPLFARFLGFGRGGPLLPSGPIHRAHARCALMASPGLSPSRDFSLNILYIFTQRLYGVHCTNTLSRILAPATCMCCDHNIAIKRLVLASTESVNTHKHCASNP